MRFAAMSDLLVVAPDTNRNTSDFLDCPEDKRRRLKLLTKEEARRIAEYRIVAEAVAGSLSGATAWLQFRSGGARLG
jgi:hypothetical protein